jgi:hypothetical protein
MVVVGCPFMQGGIDFVRFCREAEGKLFVVEHDFEEDIFDRATLVIF